MGISVAKRNAIAMLRMMPMCNFYIAKINAFVYMNMLHKLNHLVASVQQC